MAEPYETLDLEHSGSWLTVWFNEPERRNPLSDARVADLIALCARLQGSETRGVIFRGRGQMFCAGGDLSLFRAVIAGDLAQRDLEHLSRDGAQLFDAIAGLPQVTVAVAEGAALAGGLGLLSLCDITLADPGCSFALSEARIGLVAAQIAPFVAARIGLRQTRRLMITGARFDAVQAAEMGLIDHITAPDDIAPRLAELRAEVQGCAPGAVAASKALLRQLPGQSREDQITRAAEIFAKAASSYEGREGLIAFAEKRAPSWSKDPSDAL